VFGLKGIHHLAMATRDMESTIRFWRDLLGMRLVGGLGKQGYRLYFFEISPQNYVVFFEWPSVEPVPEKDHGMPFNGPMVFDHVSFAVDNDESLILLRQTLDAAGFWVSDLMDHGIIHSIYSFDPNGIPIEFSAPVTGADLGIDPKLVDTHPLDAALEGPDPVKWTWPKPSPESLKDPDARRIYPGEGEDLVSGLKKNWFAGQKKTE
jgi:catechol 2,3-dioxygenase-like lactoylglutathione lyase family enzyme